jgi:hypothetical protein
MAGITSTDITKRIKQRIRLNPSSSTYVSLQQSWSSYILQEYLANTSAVGGIGSEYIMWLYARCFGICPEAWDKHSRSICFHYCCSAEQRKCIQCVRRDLDCVQTKGKQRLRPPQPVSTHSRPITAVQLVGAVIYMISLQGPTSNTSLCIAVKHYA